jgi:dipeptidyl aminopeptidase/acylaminoacyl peptidase
VPTPLSPDILIYDLAGASDPQVSPDGARLLYTVGKTDAESKKALSQVWCARIDGSEPRQLTTGGERSNGARWSPDGKTIAFVSDRGKGRAIFLLPIDGGEARELTRHAQAIGDLAWAPDGQTIAYTTSVDPANPDEKEPEPGAAPRVRVTRRIDYKQDNRGYLGDTRLQVFVVDAASGRRRQVTRAAVDHNHPQWSPDGRTIAVRIPNRNEMAEQLGLVDVASGETKLVGPVDGTVAAWSWSPEGDRIVFAGDTTNTWQSDFFVYDVARDEIRRITDDLRPLPDAGFRTVAPPSQPVWLDARHVLFHGFQAGSSGLFRLDVESGDVETVQRWEATHGAPSLDAAHRYAAQARSSLDEVGEILVHDLATDESRVVTRQNADLLAEHQPARWEKLSIERAGLIVEAWLLFPPDFDSTKRYPLVLDVHGGPNGHYGYAFNNVQQCLATNGFLVLFANPRGSSSYGRDFTQRVIHDWGGEDYRDLMALVDAVSGRPYVDRQRQGIYGYSYGGYMTAWTIGQTDRFKAAVCGAPCFDLESMYGTSDIGHSFGDLQWGGPPHANESWYRAHSPSTYAHRATTPTLIVHGEADDRCPIGQSEQMFVSLLKAGCDVEFARYPGASHLFLRGGPADHRADYLRRVLGWFQGHL